jgi:hypothetical protein
MQSDLDELMVNDSKIVNEETVTALSKEREEEVLHLSPKPSPTRPTSPPFTSTSVFNPKKERSKFNEILSTAPPTPPSNKSSGPFRFRLLRTAQPMKPDIIYPDDD